MCVCVWWVKKKTPVLFEFCMSFLFGVCVCVCVCMYVLFSMSYSSSFFFLLPQNSVRAPPKGEVNRSRPSSRNSDHSDVSFVSMTGANEEDTTYV